MRRAAYRWAVWCMASWATVVVAHDAPDSGEAAEEARPAANEPPASPRPGEEVMHPTKSGLRFTRRMAEGFARQFVKHELGEKIPTLDAARSSRMEELVLRRAWALKENHGPEGARAAEFFYESLIRQEVNRDAKMDANAAREFSEQVRPGVRIIDDFWSGLLEDARDVLNDQELSELRQQADEALKLAHRFDQKLERWGRGEFKPNERILDGIDEEDVESSETGKTKEYVRAERQVRWRIRSMGPEEWRRFLGQAGRVLKFDAGQKTAGEALLKAYTEKAKPIMTAEWKSKVLANRVLQQLQWLCPKEPLDPWAFHLDREYLEMTRPVVEMGRAFHRDVLGLARPDQRDLMLADLRKVGSDHGMKPEEVEGAIEFPQTQPGGQ